MKPEFINIGNIRIRLKDISDYQISYYRIERHEQTYTESGFFKDKTILSYFETLEECPKDISDFGVLFVKVYKRKNTFCFISKRGLDLINNLLKSPNRAKTIYYPAPSSQEDVDVEGTLKKLDEYLS